MKKEFLAIMAIAGLTSTTAALADISDIKASNSQIGIQYISTKVDYTETGIVGTSTGTLDTEAGNVPGYALSISAMKDLLFTNDYIKAEYDHSTGYTNYVGGLIGPPQTPYGSVLATSSAKLINYSADYGKGFALGNQFMLTPYAELGKHTWVRGVNFGETYINHYYGIGMMGQYSPVGKLVLSANYLIGQAYDSAITATASNGAILFTTGLGQSTLQKFGASADYAFTKNLHGNIGVDYTTFKYGISAPTPIGSGYVAWEPDSKTNYTTFKLGLGYAF